MDAAPDIVVGFDGGNGAESAVDWAANEALQRGVGLRIVMATTDRSRAVDEILADGRLRAEKVLDAASVAAATVRGHAAHALVEESREASLVVVGHSERARTREFVTGSVAFAVAAHARCDVAVVPHGDLVVPAPDYPVVVGTDGSPDAERAARQAAQFAARCGAPLVLVRAWQLPSLAGWPGPPAAADALLDEYADFEKAASGPSESSAVALRRAFPGVDVQTRLIAAHPVEALLKASKDAGLLVVGTHGRGRFHQLLLGSVSRALIHHAETPVLVVRPCVAV
jgi:nucleotide-binding universal stress UspA family protein